jgi:xanthine phosphoribosyltransferase
MKLLENKILTDGRVLQGEILKVDSFLNNKIDPMFLKELAAEFARLYEGEGVTKILTAEASGIALAAITGLQMAVPVVYARKTRSAKVSPDVYSARVISFTHGNEYTVTVAKEYITEEDKILIIDDFISNGSTMRAMVDICRTANADLVGAGIAIEKVFSRGAERIRASGVRVEALARIGAIEDDGTIKFV